jgi:D-3-phosphoglycerate dehydrogenase
MVSYTPDAPAPAVAELTVGLMFSLLRSIHISNSQLHAGKWNRYFGRRISEVDIGLIGAGRIGTQVLHLLSGMGVKTILVNEIRSDLPVIPGLNIEWVNKEVIYRNADIISLHVPLTALTSNMITSKELSFMKPDAMLVNTARGGIINEKDLESFLASGMLSGVAIDVFNEEPYFGPLRLVERCLLTAHMGSMSIDCRTRMEVEATEEAIRFFTGIPLKNLVPAEEYKFKHQEV